MFNSLVLYGTYIAKDFRYNEQFELNEQRIQSAIWFISLGSTDFFSGISPEELRSHDYDLYKRKKNEQIGVVSNNQPVMQTVPCPFFQPSTNIFLNNSSNHKSNNIDLNNNMNNPFNLPLYSPVTHVPIPKVCLIDANVNTPIKIVINKEKEILFLMLCMSPLAFPAEIAGTKAVAKAILKDKGSITSVSIFPLKIPY